LGGGVSIRTFDSLQSNLGTAWPTEDDKPLRCCALNGANEVVLSSMKIDIRYQIA